MYSLSRLSAIGVLSWMMVIIGTRLSSGLSDTPIPACFAMTSESLAGGPDFSWRVATDLPGLGGGADFFLTTTFAMSLLLLFKCYSSTVLISAFRPRNPQILVRFGTNFSCSTCRLSQAVRLPAWTLLATSGKGTSSLSLLVV